MAEAAHVSSAMISQVLSGEKHLSPEQAVELSMFLKLSETEFDFFLLMVDLGRASSPRLKAHIQRKLKLAKQASLKLSKRAMKDFVLSETDMATYYSSWLYTGIRNLVAVEEFNSIEKISERLKLSEKAVRNVVHFLIEKELLTETEGRLAGGKRHTHVGSESAFVNHHRRNWRVRGLEAMQTSDEDQLFYTCPMSLSNKAVEKIRDLLPDFIERVLKIVGPSPSEEVFCLNIDWFRY
jgi:uncharacterized protein (TIGR02147 family)